ncbi:MAG: PaaI family thioesterase [Bacillota bacterium]|nr:PaaI family thioesterase [Bacillota bacterium]
MAQWAYSHHCFVCGKDNPHGLKARFWVDGPQSRTALTPPAHVRGFPGILQGGVVAALLDETMWYAAFGAGFFTLTADLKIRFRRPTPLGALKAFGEVASERRQIVLCRAQLVDERGEVLAQGEGKFFVIPPQKVLQGEEEVVVESCPGSLNPPF